jgi:hypothetical protein
MSRLPGDPIGLKPCNHPFLDEDDGVPLLLVPNSILLPLFLFLEDAEEDEEEETPFTC